MNFNCLKILFTGWDEGVIGMQIGEVARLRVCRLAPLVMKIIFAEF